MYIRALDGLYVQKNMTCSGSGDELHLTASNLSPNSGGQSCNIWNSEDGTRIKRDTWHIPSAKTKWVTPHLNDITFWELEILECLEGRRWLSTHLTRRIVWPSNSRFNWREWKSNPKDRLLSTFYALNGPPQMIDLTMFLTRHIPYK